MPGLQRRDRQLDGGVSGLGDAWRASTSNIVMQVVQPGSSMTSVTSSPNPSTSGEAVTITATVSPAGPPAPTGTVSFTSNGTAISGCTAVPLSSSLTAVCTTFDAGGGDGCDRSDLLGRYELFRQQRHALATGEPDSIASAIRRCHPVPAGGHATAERQRPDSGRHLPELPHSARGWLQHSYQRRSVFAECFRGAASIRWVT